jgi:hypothetical protein
LTTAVPAPWALNTLVPNTPARFGSRDSTAAVCCAALLGSSRLKSGPITLMSGYSFAITSLKPTARPSTELTFGLVELM